MIRQLKSKDLNNFLSYCTKRDKYSDFYVTLDNKRIFLNNIDNAKKVFNNCLKHGDKCLVLEEEGLIKAVLIVTGYSDNFNRKYLKILADTDVDVLSLIKVLSWNYNMDLYIKAKPKNPIVTQSQKMGFRIVARREKEFLLFRKFRRRISKDRYNRTQ